MNVSVDEAAADSSECWKIVHIPEKPPVLPQLQATVDVLASAIESKHANTIVRKLNHIAPLEGLRHVKRIQKTCYDEGKSQLFVILCKAPGSDAECNSLPEDVLELVNMYQSANMLHQQKKNGKNNASCGQLPFILPPNGITGFSEGDSLSVFNFMKLAVHMAKSGPSVVNAAVIVDPSTGQVIASSCDEVLSCSLMKSTSRESCCSKQPQATIQYDSSKTEKDRMLLLEFSSNEANQSYKDVSCLHPWGWLEQPSHLSYDSWHPLRHAAVVAIENSAARDRCLFPANAQDVQCAQEVYNSASPTGSPLKRQKVLHCILHVKDDEQMDFHKNGLQRDSSRPYLCTGYDIYFVWEPCIMCAMAIVHQRIRRVFYAFPNPNDGALGSVHRLQGERSLNHHYAVFRVLLPQNVLKSKELEQPSKIDPYTTQLSSL